MFSFIRQTYCQWARTGTRPGAQPRAVRRLECEALEDRMLLSLTGAQLFANSLGANSQATLASSPGGRSIVAWTVENSPSDHDVKAQLFDASGNKLGGVITVAGGTENQYSPSVAINAAGQFAVAWTIDFSTTDTDVHATLFRADGSRVRDDFGVATSWKREYEPSVGIDARGDFTVSYTYQFASDDTDVKAVQYDAGANLLRSLDVAVSTRMENHSHIAMAATGQFTVSYLVDGQSTVRYFSSSGQPLESGQGGSTTPPTVTPPPHVTPPPPPPPTPPILTGILAGGYFSGPVGATGHRALTSSASATCPTSARPRSRATCSPPARCGRAMPWEC